MAVSASNRGFTLLELLFLVFIVSILIGLAYPNIVSALDQASYIECESRLEMLRRAKSTYVLDHLGQGSPTTAADQAVFRVYLPQRFTFVCPRDSGSSYVQPYNLYSVTTCPYCATHIPEGAREREATP
jgi:prepilin-type N-terminal cleavage/methylation domain-containing protein